MESRVLDHYGVGMPHDLGALLGRSLRSIRKRTTGTQDDWTGATGMSQSYLSAAERGESGWESLRTIASAIEKAGADPLDLLRLAVASAELDPQTAELLSLWAAADPDIRGAILMLLRGQVAARTAAR